MAVLIGHASISETGGVNGAKGDSTGREVCTRAWYSKPWDYMAIYPDAAIRDKHAKTVEAACANNYVGYGQSDRNTANTEAKKVGYDISKIKTKCNTDCSALQNLAAVAAGTPGVTYGSNGWTTSTMLAALKTAGYKIITDSAFLKSADYCVRGAIYVKAGSHTVTGLTDGAKAAQTLKKAGITGGNTASTTTAAKPTTTTGGNSYMFSVGLIKSGSKGADVLLFEKITKATGDYTGNLDSQYGSKCVAACKAIQKRYGLTADGECGVKTWPKVLGV